MKVQVIVTFAQLLTVYSITVPPYWPKSSPQNIKNTLLTGFQPLTTPSSITHDQFRFPTFFPGDSIQQPKIFTDELNFRPSNKQNIYVQHPKVSKTNQIETITPHSYQIINFDNQNTNLHSVPNSNKNRQRNIQRNYKRKLPKVRQHLTEVTSEPGFNNNLKFVNRKELKPKATQIREQRVAENKDEDSNENLEEEEEFVSEHETPRDVPTRPIYPGEGQWAKFGVKHKPYINKDAIKVKETEEDDERPEGYETFEQGEEQFKIAQNKFRHNLELFPQKHNLPPSQISNYESESKPLYEKPEIDFVPQKLYTQVRRTENEQHLPRSAIDPEQEENAERLREIIKDSISHTVYTEEGYEDSAYDHEGHEKNAENSEGHAESISDHAEERERNNGSGKSQYSDEGGKKYGRNSVRKRLHSNTKSKNEDFSDEESYEKTKKQIEEDAAEASSENKSKKLETIPKKEIKKVTVKNNDKEEINMEIHTEIKYTPELKKHKYIKIIPVPKNNTNQISFQSVTSTTIKPPVLRGRSRRVKRYDKETLSKKYVRKRPNYYWKRIKTTTQQPQINTKQKFENVFKLNKKLTKSKTVELKAEKEDESTITPITTTRKIMTKPTILLHLKSSESHSTSTESLSSTTTTTTPSISTPYSITIPPTRKSVSTSTSSPTSNGTKPSLTPPKIVEELHPDLMNPELTTKASRPSLPKVLPVKIKKFIKKRSKRYVIDHPKIEINFDEFVDVEKLPDPTQQPDLTHIKYPYYSLPISSNLNENSPLRYSEDMRNIPHKIENEMSFYESRNQIICPEIESDVNPIPERVANQKEGEETGKMADTPNLPRLKGLGDKIDCLKAKYFGENPLDSPFFQEEIVETPLPLFTVKTDYKPKQIKKITEQKSAANNNNAFYYKMRKNIKKDDSEDTENKSDNINTNNKKRELKVKILEPIVVLDEEIFDAATMNPIHQSTEAVLKPPYTLEEMMTMNKEKIIPFKPKSIYDKITLLEQNDTKDITTENNNDMITDKLIIIYENQEKKTRNKTKKHKQPEDEVKKSEIENISKLTSMTFNTDEEKTSTTTISNLPSTEPISTTKTSQIFTRKPPTKKPVNSIRKLAIKAIRKPTIKTTTTTIIPQTETNLLINKNTLRSSTNIAPPKTLKLPLKVSQTEPAFTSSSLNTNPENWPTVNRKVSAFYNIFDVSQYLPKIPNHRIVSSEVQYKEEIKPSEQMTVYSDVLKTISESKQATKFNADTVKTTKIKNQINSITTTTAPEIDEQTEPQSQNQTNQSIQENESTNSQEYHPETSDQIIGLVPPPNSAFYQQVYQYFNSVLNKQKPEEIQEAEASKNYYYFLGLKPFKMNQKHIISKRDVSNKNDDEDLLMEESKYEANIWKPKKRNKRNEDSVNNSEDDLLMDESEYRPVYTSPPGRRPAYTEIVRARPSRPQNEETEDEEEEDLNPRKRFYEIRSSKPTTESPISQYEEIIEEEIEDEKETTTTKKPKIYKIEADPNNPGLPRYLTFIENVKQKWAIEDATSTTIKPPIQETTPENLIMTQFTTETVNIRRGEPKYLQIINKLHEKREQEARKTSTTVEPTTSTTERVYTAPIRNSNPFVPDGFLSELKTMQLKLENDNTAESSNNPETSSRARNFDAKFRTSIDTSKYKTIERGPVTLRHNFSSRFNAQDQELPLSRGQTTQKPMIIAIITTPSEISTSTTESTHEAEIIAKVLTDRILQDVSPRIIEAEVTTTTASTPIARIRQRGRVRARPTTTTTSKPLTTSSNTLIRRRRPSRTTTTTTTTQSPISPNNFRRRMTRLKTSETRTLLSDLPSNHRPVFTPISEESTEKVVVVTPVPLAKLNNPNTEEPKNKRRFQKVQERRVTSEVTLTRYFEPTNSDESRDAEDSEELEESKKNQYEIIGPLTHTDTKHGGNYRYENDQQYNENSQEDGTSTITDRYSDVAPPAESFFADPNLAINVNHLKEKTDETTTKTQASNNLFTNEEISEKVTLKPSRTKVSLYPNMARMVNRLAESRTVEVHHNGRNDEEENKEKPAFIKDPSRRMYYYAKL